MNEREEQGFEQPVDTTEDYKTKYLSMCKDFENFRIRTDREKKELVDIANAKLITSLSYVLDSFNRSLEMSTDIGTTLIYKQFRDVLVNAGLEIISPEPDSKFDPSIHEAISLQSSDEVSKDNIIDVLNDGYKLGNKILKYATVSVSSGV